MSVDASGWGRLTLVWEGWDGSSWEISDPTQRTVVDYIAGVPQPPRTIIESGVFVPRGGVRGMNMPEIQRYTSESPMVAGARWRGYRVQEREVFWPLLIASDESSEVFKLRERAFFKTMRPDKMGTWNVIQPDGEMRSLRLRFKDDSSATHEDDPIYFGRAVYGITLVAEQPFWEGPTITRRWGLGSTLGFFAGPGVINISAGQGLDDATIPNPGDVDGWLVWTIAGSFTSATVGVNGKLIEVPFALTNDRKLVVDTRPDRLTAYEYAVTDTDLTGAYVDRTDDLGDVVFGSVPFGDEVPLTVVVNGAGATAYATGDLIPLHYRAW